MKTEVRLNKDQSTLDALGSTKGKPALLSLLWMQTRAHSRQQVNYLRSSNDTLTCVNSVIYSLGNYVTSKMYLSVRSLLIWKKVISNLGLKKTNKKQTTKRREKHWIWYFTPKDQRARWFALRFWLPDWHFYTRFLENRHYIIHPDERQVIMGSWEDSFMFWMIYCRRNLLINLPT